MPGIAVLAALALPAPSQGAEERAASPLLSGSPWPEMRHDMRNTGSSAIRGRWRGDQPWSFRTGRGIFSTPVIGDDGTAYVGSADGNFYALDRHGRERWRLRTGGIIDAAAALGARRGKGGDFPITIGSGDETLYQLSGRDRRLSRRERIRWTYETPLQPATGQLVNWWEGNPAYGPDGNIFVGNTGGGAYSLTPGGEQRWVVQRANSVWTTPAFDAEGNSYWGSVDFFAFSLDPQGAQRWETFTPGYVTSSPALGSDGTVYVGSFDRGLHALDPQTGAERWTFPTADHIYGSPALASDSDGRTSAIYIGSADGSIYAVRPDGSGIWRYDTGEPVRSSPVLGRAPQGNGRIVYVGSSNGKLYALDAETGKRRWSFDTTPGSAELADRNDLNGSPALGRRGVHIGGEHGRVWFVPYDYCRKSRDARCSRAPGQEFGANVDRVLPVTPGGTTVDGSRESVPASTVLGSRLIVRRDGVTANAGIEDAGDTDALVDPKPSFDFHTELSGDGHYLFIRPDGFLKPDTEYRVRVAGGWMAGDETGGFGNTLRFRTDRSRGAGAPLSVGRKRVDALELSRLALPLPSLLPSVNQIGFDSYDLIAGTLWRTQSRPNGSGRILMWVVGAQPAGNGGSKADPDGGFAFPLYGTYRRDEVALQTSQVSLQFSFGPVPLRSMDFRGALAPSGGFRPGASLFGQVTCGDVPNYSIQLRVAGVCNATDTLAAYGTFLSDRYERGGANERPSGVGAGAVSIEPPGPGTDGEALARITLEPGTRFRAEKHFLSLLLVDGSTGAPVGLDYRTLTTQETDANGNVVAARLRIPAGTQLPATLRAYTIADVFPLGTTTPVVQGSG